MDLMSKIIKPDSFDAASSSPTQRDWLILGVLALIWGSSFILIKYGLKYFNPIQVGSLRLIIASLAFLPIVLINLRKIDFNQWKWLLAVGLCGSGIPAFMFPLAQMQLSSTVAGILNTLTPLFTLLIGFLLFKNRITSAKILGVLIGFIGAVLLIVLGEKIEIDDRLIYGLYILIATICYGTSVNIVGNKFKNMNPTLLSSVSFSFLLPLGLYFFFQQKTYDIFFEQPDAINGLLIIALLSLVGTFFASILFYKMVQRTHAVFGASVTYLIPIVSTIWGVADGELFTLYHILGALLILFGVYLSRKK